MRPNAFRGRVFTQWNGLSEEMVSIQSVKLFKMLLYKEADELFLKLE